MEGTLAKSITVLKKKNTTCSHRHRDHDLLYTIDVLTDGSEGTGDGTVFLSVWKQNGSNIGISNAKSGSTDHNNDDDTDNDWYTAAPAARYCLSGAMNADATSRLAADQRFKLGTCLRAIFCAPPQSQQQESQQQGLNNKSQAGYYWWGMTPLHLALRKAGAASVHVIVADPSPPVTTPGQQASDDDDDGTAMDTLENVIALTEGGGSRGSLYPVVHICKVPPIDESSSSSSPWWKVYQDEYLLVHARRMTSNNASSSSLSSAPTTTSADAVLFLYTLITHNEVSKENGSSPSFTFFTSFIVSSPHDCSVPDLAKIMRQPRAAKNENNTKSSKSTMSSSRLRLPVVSLNEKDAEIPLQCPRFAIGLRPSTLVASTSCKTRGQSSHKPSSSDSSGSSSSSSSDDDDDDDDNSSSSDEERSSTTSSSVLDDANGDETVYWTQPSQTTDPSLLVRAQQQGIEWNEGVPEFFSWNRHSHCSSDSPETVRSHTESHSRNRLQTGTSLAFTANQNERSFIVDRMATIIRRTKRHNCNSDANIDSSSSSNGGIPRQTWPHRQLDFLKSPLVAPGNVSGTPLLTEVDENEIDLEDEHNDDGEGNSDDMKNSSDNEYHDFGQERHVVKLLVLGTGCASPSAYRGASGYALLFPQMTTTVTAPSAARNNHLMYPAWAMVIEAGEGFVTQWHRHATMSLCKIRFVWVSHAHWDHYGGLAPLLVAIANAQPTHSCLSDDDDETKSIQCGHQRKKSRRDTSTATTCTQSSLPSSPSGPGDTLDNEPPWVMAPRKVLKFLELVLPTVKTKNGKRHRFYRGVPMDEDNNAHRRRSPTLKQSAHCPSNAFDDLNKHYGRPIAFWENIQVDHCQSAFGFVAGLRRTVSLDAPASVIDTGTDDDPFIFAFSGDTRPCQRFVRVCQERVHSRCHPCGESVPTVDNGVNFLLHEATFDEEEQEMAIAKKHSTIREALQVAQKVKADRILLTHFSQRYNNDSLFNNTDTTENGLDTTSSSLPHKTKVGVALDGMLVPLYDSKLMVR
jgi:ribonuclease BN (tRNA processing enzyme)